jgi:hypothetical protein
VKDVEKENGNRIIIKLWSRRVVVPIKFYNVFIPLQKMET